MVAALGGPADFVERYPDRLPAARVVRDVVADRTGFVTAIDGEALGHAVVRLGGGRLRGGDRINPSVGLSEIMPLGEPVEAGEAVARVHAASAEDAERAAAAVRSAIAIAEEEPEEPPLIHERIG
jgi:thymidine phosphorylase